MLLGTYSLLMTTAAELQVPLNAAPPAGIKLPAIISDHMVLQKSAKTPIWGKASPGEEIIVTLDNQSVSVRTGTNGKWKVDLNLDDVGPGPFKLVVVGRDATLVISDVVIGEVWVASGQSNMELMLKDSSEAENEIARAANPVLR